MKKQAHSQNKQAKVTVKPTHPKTGRVVATRTPQRIAPERQSIQSLGHKKRAAITTANVHTPAAVRKKKSSNTTSLAKHRKKRLKWGRLFFLMLVSVGLGYSSFWLVTAGAPILYFKLASDIRQISRSITPPPYSAGAYSSLSNQIALYLAKQPGTYSVAGSDLVTGAVFGDNGATQFSAAQTIALPVAMTLYSDIAAHIISKNATVKLTAADEQAGPGYIGGMPYGSAFTVTQLARAALVKGDVVAINMLIRKLGVDQINSFISGMGSASPLSEPYLTSAQDLSISLSYLYTMDKAHPHSVAPLMQDLEATPSEGRIKAGVGKGVAVAHVLGDWPNEFHDAAIIWTAGHPVTLAICSDNVTSSAAAAVEAHIAKMVSQFEISGS